jgi:hypothetical protein
MPDTGAPEHRITRRRFLVAAGAIVVGGLAAASLDLLGTLTRVARPTPSAAPTPEPHRVYFSRPDLAPPIIESTASGVAPAPGFIFLTPSNGTGHDGPTIVDDAGELVWMRPGTGKAMTDLRVSSYRGEPVLTWWEGTNNGGIGSGEHVVIDGSYRELTRIQAVNGRQADLHELQLTPAGTALFFADTGTAPAPAAGATPGYAQVMDCEVQEIDLATGSLVFEWHAADHIALDESVVGAPTGANAVYDYVHANSIDVDTDGNLIVSARNTSAIYKIDRRSGAIRWRLGGKRSDFAMGPGTAFAFQHDARRQPDGTLTLFDDGAGPGPSRAIVLRLDETAMTATLVREYTQPQKLFATSQGNMQVLPDGHVFVGWGSLPHFSEFGADGTLLLNATFTASQSYRDYRFPWVGRPTDTPTVSLQNHAGQLTLYASWNGATEVAAWDVLAGAGAAALSKVASAPRSGFETSISLTTKEQFVAVRALDASGNMLGTSPLASTT